MAVGLDPMPLLPAPLDVPLESIHGQVVVSATGMRLRQPTGGLEVARPQLETGLQVTDRIVETVRVEGLHTEVHLGPVLVVGILSPDPLTNQEEDIGGYFSQAPPGSGFFIADNDLLYGGWAMKYVRDLRPDLVLLSTGNFSGWFEDMAVRFNPDLDLSRSVTDVGGTALGRSELAVRLIQATVEDNPQRQFFGDW